MAIDVPLSFALLPRGLAWPLVGRDDELRCIADLHAAPGRAGVVVAGPSGVGKSHLARHAAAAAERSGALVVWAVGTTSAATVPLGAVAGLLPPDMHTTDPAVLPRRVATHLRDRASGRTVVLAVDDAQLLDRASAELVMHLAGTGTAFVLTTIRSGTTCPDAVRSLWEDTGVVRLDLGALTADETGRLMELVLAGLVEPEARRWLVDRSRGNPLYARELLLGALADRALQRRDGLWRLLHVPEPSPSLVDLVEIRAAGLDTAERAALELLALGEPLRLDELTVLAGQASVAAVEAHGTVVVDGDGPAAEVRLAHPLYGDVLRSAIPALRAAAITCRLAGVLRDRRDRTPTDVLRLVCWLVEADGDIPAHLLLEATEAAYTAGDLDLAVELSTRAIHAGEGNTAVMLLARARNAQGRGTEADALLAPLENTFATQDEALRYLILRLTVLMWGMVRSHAAALALADRAAGWWPGPDWAGRLAPLQARLAAVIDGEEPVPAAAVAARSGTVIDAFGEHVDVHQAFYRGAVGEAHRLVMNRLPRIPLRGEAAEVACVMRCLTGMEGGEERAELVAWLHANLPVAVWNRDHAAAGLISVTLGGLDLAAGRYVDATRRLSDAVGHFERRDPNGLLACAHALRAETAYRLGDAAAAGRAATRARGEFGNDPVLLTHLPYLARGEAWAAVAAGDHQRAQRILLDAAVQLGRLPLFAAQLHHEALRAGAPARPLVRPLETLRARCDATLVELYLRHVRMRAAGDAPELLRCADDFARLDAARYAAECAAAAAEILAGRGRTDSARRAAARSRELHGRGQGGTAPEIRGVEDAGVRLTRRERQVAELAAQGLTNAQIGERLTISVRTVESHLYRAMQKRGLRRRHELSY